MGRKKVRTVRDMLLPEDREVYDRLNPPKSKPLAPKPAYKQVRTTDPATSKRQAYGLRDLTEVQRRVYQLYDEAERTGLCDEDMTERYLKRWEAPDSSPRKRRCDLRDYDIVVKTDRTILWPNGSGNLTPRIVWVLKKWAD